MVAEVAEAEQFVLCRGLTSQTRSCVAAAVNTMGQNQRPEADIKKEWSVNSSHL